MKDDKDIRWRQRFRSYQTALRQLGEAVALRQQRPLSNLEKQGAIQAFEFTYELGWNTLKDYLAYQGIPDLVGARDTIREAFRRELIRDGDGWMEMLADRNLTSHTYNVRIADEVVRRLCGRYHGILLELRDKLGAIEANL